MCVYLRVIILQEWLQFLSFIFFLIYLRNAAKFILQEFVVHFDLELVRIQKLPQIKFEALFVESVVHYLMR